MKKIWKRLKEKLVYMMIQEHVSPQIIAYKDVNGVIIKKSRVSNLTHISNKDNVCVEENVFIGHYNYIDGHDKVFIGEGCQITNFVNIVTHSSHNSIRLNGNNYIKAAQEKKLFGIEEGPISVGCYTYIGPHTVIMPNVKIGMGCIIGAFSYVNKDIPDYTIVRGQPAEAVGSTKSSDENYINKFPEAALTHFLNERG